jgi:hypothetical protein
MFYCNNCKAQREVEYLIGHPIDGRCPICRICANLSPAAVQAKKPGEFEIAEFHERRFEIALNLLYHSHAVTDPPFCPQNAAFTRLIERAFQVADQMLAFKDTMFERDMKNLGG